MCTKYAEIEHGLLTSVVNECTCISIHKYKYACEKCQNYVAMGRVLDALFLSLRMFSEYNLREKIIYNKWLIITSNE